MLTYVVAFFISLVVAAATTPLVVRLAHKIDAIDLPGEARKIHTRAIPRIGGIAVVLGFFTPIAGLAIYNNRISWLIYGSDINLMGTLILGSAGILALGVYDDIRGADAKLKLAVQSIVAVIVWFGGFRIDLLGLPLAGTFEVGFLSLPLTVLWVVGIVNALNLIDGLDGLATGTALFAVAVLFGVSFVDHAALLAVLLASLGGALLGFLFFNFNPAKIFLGDSGSMFIGFILATASMWTQRKGATAAALLIPVLALGLPILDTTLSVVRRVGQGRNPFRADKEHLHHRLLALGLSHRTAVLTLYLVSGVFALGALALLDVDATRRSIALATVAMVLVIFLRRVGIFQGPRRVPVIAHDPGVLRQSVRETVRAIRRAVDNDGVWAALTQVAPQLGLAEIELTWTLAEGDVHGGGRELTFRWLSEHSKGRSRLEGPLGPYDDVRRRELSERGAQLGRVMLLRVGGPQDSALSEEYALCCELLTEALVDYRVAQNQASSSRVVRLPSGTHRPPAIASGRGS